MSREVRPEGKSTVGSTGKTAIISVARIAGLTRVWLSVIVLLSLAVSLGCQSRVPSGGVLRIWDTGPITLDPAISQEGGSHAYILQIFGGLVRLDDKLLPAPDIAQKWSVSNGGKTFTFYLRRGVKFHSGRDVKAADFKFSWERACAPETGSSTAVTYLGDILGAGDVLAGKRKNLAGVKVIDDYTLEVTIDAPKAYFLSKLSYPTGFVVDRENVGAGDAWWQKPSGTGPFKLLEWEKDKSVTLERNADYHLGAPNVSRVAFQLYQGVPLAAYEMGEVDVAPVSEFYMDRATDPKGPFASELKVVPELSFYYVGFNTTRPPFDDLKVRQAFSQALDKEKVIRVILKDTVRPAQGIVPPGMPGHNPDLAVPGYDRGKAAELLASSRYRDGLPPLKVTVSGWGNQVPQYLGAIMAQWQANLGASLSVRQLEPENFLYSLKEERDEIFLLGWVADYPDPQNFLDNLFHTGYENNVSGYSNATLDRLLDQAAVEQDERRRYRLYQQAEAMVVADAPVLPLWFGVNNYVVKPGVAGFEYNPLGVPRLTRVSLAR